jgi:glycosyltransferase involved in cell wall biosynthesis
MTANSMLQNSNAGPMRRLRPQHLSDLLKVELQSPAPVVYLAGKSTAMAAPGGGEVQMLSLARCLPDAGIDVRLWRPWEHAWNDADCLHLFGSEPEYLPIVAAAKQKRIPVALSTIAWFDLRSRWHEPNPMARRLMTCGKYVARAALPGLPSWRRELYHACDLLMPNSEAEAEQLMRLFRIGRERIHIVPNGADERFANADPRLFDQLAGSRNFVLYPGRIEPRKNQLGFLKAMRNTDVPIVLLGDVVPGQEAYLAECHRVAGPQVKFLGRLEHDDPLLASAYAACGCVALASWYETPGLVALEAGMSGVPLVLPQGGCAPEYFGKHAEYVSGSNHRDIREKVLAALLKPRSPELAELVQSRYSWEAAARTTREAYETLL